MSGAVYLQNLITRADVRDRRGALFVFGDNMQRKGYGGQARAMRGEPNAIGVPTKWAPDRRAKSYFSDADFDRVRDAIDDAFREIRRLQNQGLDVVLPADGLGTGLAELPRRAPRIHAYIEKHIASLDTGA